MFAALTLQALLVLVPAPREKDGPDKGPGFLGIAYEDNDGNGFLVTEVYANSPAKKAGLLIGDRVMTLAGKKLTNIKSFVREIIRIRPGTVVDMEIQRGSEKKTIKVKIGVRPDDFPFPLPEPEDLAPKPDDPKPETK